MPFLLLLLLACPTPVDPCADGGDLEAGLREDQVTCADICAMGEGETWEEDFSGYGTWNQCTQVFVHLAVTVEDCARCEELEACLEGEDPGEAPVLAGMEVELALQEAPPVVRATLPWTDPDGDVDRVLDRVEAGGTEDRWPVTMEWDPPPCGQVSGTLHATWTWEGEGAQAVAPTSLLVALSDERGHVSEAATWP